MAQARLVLLCGICYRARVSSSVDRLHLARTDNTVIWSDLKQNARHLLRIGDSTSFIVGSQASSQTTAFNVYNASSAQPLREARLPYLFREITLLSTRQSGDPARSLNLLGLTSTGEIFRFGDNVPAQVSHTRVVKTDGQKGTSVWQEMFGKDAFVDELVLPEVADAPVVGPQSGRPIEVFDGPSHTMPPVSLLFDSFIGRILQPRNADTLSTASQQPEEKILFEQESAKPISTVSAPKPRVISDQELEGLEKLFRDMSSTSESCDQMALDSGSLTDLQLSLCQRRQQRPKTGSPAFARAERRPART